VELQLDNFESFLFLFLFFNLKKEKEKKSETERKTEERKHPLTNKVNLKKKHSTRQDPQE
jgi:hypothetical protein